MIEQHICDLKISVHGIDLVQSLKPVDDLLEEGSGFILGQPALLLEVALKISAIAVLHDNEDTPLRGEVVDESDNILIFALLQDSHFSLDQLLQFRSVDHELLGDDLDGYLALITLVNGLVDDSPCALA